MNLDALLEKMNRLEFHQSLLLKMISNNEEHFYKLIIEKSLSRNDLEQFNKRCDELTVVLQQQKAEGFVYFDSLFADFQKTLHPNLNAEEVVRACLRQQLYLPLMLEFKKFV